MPKPLHIDQFWNDRISDQLNGLEYGSVLITVHDGRIVQIDRTERKRFDPPASAENRRNGDNPIKSVK
ncbi:YezD family protein [Paenibacillus pinihumi]|uniref:YezD family protein n=1 Tax=Paenibacillus pinihumi TaxID=669462 RepID=UPI000411C4DD|nr:YezD family protein [Paenibacillus pinihumi]